MTDAAASSNGSQNAAGNGGAGATGGDAAVAATGSAATGAQGNGQPAATTQAQTTTTTADPFAGLKAPAGFDAAHLPKIIEVAKGYGLTAENAQKLINDTHARQVQAKADMDAALAKQKAEWHEAIKADKEYGGDKFEASLQRAQKVIGEIDQKIAPGIKKLIEASGYGDEPSVVRLFNYLGAQNREDTFAAGGNNAAGNTPLTLTEQLYPKS